ncbi:MAG: hypothetical protein RIQ79_2195 [Verrucomicrobiota bacterium]
MPRFFPAFTLLILLVALPACSPPPPVASVSTAFPVAAVVPVPPELTAALAAYRASGPKGWAFTQTSVGTGKNLIERFDPRVRGPARWTLLRKDGREPTDEEQKEYRQQSLAKNEAEGGGVRDQLDLVTCALVARDERTATYQFALRPADKGDTAAAHMRARFTLDFPTGAIVRVELSNFEHFSPVISLKIDEASTIMRYSLPSADQPSLLIDITMKLRGRRLWFRSFTQDMSMSYSDQVSAVSPGGEVTPK